MAIVKKIEFDGMSINTTQYHSLYSLIPILNQTIIYQSDRDLKYCLPQITCYLELRTKKQKYLPHCYAVTNHALKTINIEINGKKMNQSMYSSQTW